MTDKMKNIKEKRSLFYEPLGSILRWRATGKIPSLVSCNVVFVKEFITFVLLRRSILSYFRRNVVVVVTM